MGQDGATMRALVRDAYGSVDVLRLAEVDKPVADDGEVLVRVHAAQPPPLPAPAGPRATGDARDHRRRRRWQLARNPEAIASGRALALRPSEARLLYLKGAQPGP